LYREQGKRFLFLHDHAVEEYYSIDLEQLEFRAYTRSPLRRALVQVRDLDAFVSPRLGVRFEPCKEGVIIRRSDRTPFGTLADALNQRDEARSMMHRLALLTRKVLWNEATEHDRAELDRLLFRVEYL
ncbi:MAG: hypothetical protein ACRC33_18620, partial [Gemmataceae bacterium]